MKIRTKYDIPILIGILVVLAISYAGYALFGFGAEIWG
jgi:hypothetical protein